MVGKIVFCEKNGSLQLHKTMYEEPFYKIPLILAMVVQKIICWPNLAALSGVQYAVAAAASTVKQAQAAAAAR